MTRLKVLLVTAALAATSVSFAQGNTLTIASAQDPQSWDPIDTFLIAWGTVSHNLYDGLIIRSS
ncbi:MAG: ABC transporter substrate-binding protein, partial [Deinococcus sp.]